MSSKMILTGGCDIGNGYSKIVIRGRGAGGSDLVDAIDIPSGVAVINRPNQLPVPDADVVVETQRGGEQSIFNQLDVSFASPLVTDPYRRLFGARGINAKGAFEEFDVIGRRSKAEQPLSKVLVLGLFAAKALKDYVALTGSLPPADEALSVEARVALALPITEYLQHRTAYAAEFVGTRKAGLVHTVTIHNFETPVTVKLKFLDVQVLPEGASAQYAITAKGEPLMAAMLADVRRRGLELDGVTAADLLAAQHTIGIDVGEGTTNFPVFTDGRFNPDTSTTFNKGYGTVLTDALDSMEAQGFHSGFSSRKQLAAYLQAGPSPIKKAFYERVKMYVDEEVLFFAREVAEHFGRMLSVVGATTEVAYVYGGGSGPVKDLLYPLLMEKVTEMSGMASFPVLYLDAGYSRHLNREGLYIAATTMENRAAAANPKAS